MPELTGCFILHNFQINLKTGLGDLQKALWKKTKFIAVDNIRSSTKLIFYMHILVLKSVFNDYNSKIIVISAMEISLKLLHWSHFVQFSPLAFDVINWDQERLPHDKITKHPLSAQLVGVGTRCTLQKQLERQTCLLKRNLICDVLN